MGIQNAQKRKTILSFFNAYLYLIYILKNIERFFLTFFHNILGVDTMNNNFLWGASEAGFQFEMESKNDPNNDTNTDWYLWVRDPINIKNRMVSGDFPEDGIGYWNRFRNDHDLAKSIGMNAYRIGIEWSRIFPESTRKIHVDYETNDMDFITEIEITDYTIEQLRELVNHKALSHYRDIIMDLRSKGLKVIVNLNHFTLPLWIHNPITARSSNLEEGPLGWIDRMNVIEFTKYAAFMASELGDIVDMWSTFNEPYIVIESGYLMPEVGFPPGVNRPDAYMSGAMNLIMAHVHGYNAIKQWDTVKADDDSENSAFIGIIHNISPAYPLDPSNELDVQAAEHFNEIRNYLLLTAITKGEIDIDVNLEITDEERIPEYKNKLDWIGINYYTRIVVSHSEEPMIPFSEVTDFKIEPGFGVSCVPNSKSRGNRTTTDFGWEIYPEGMRDVINQVSRYGLPMYITENGIADAFDILRPYYIITHIDSMLKAINEDKKDVRGYFHWALTDNYEWSEGFSKKFGLIEVDLQTKERRLRDSAYIFKEIVTNGLSDKLKEKYNI